MAGIIYQRAYYYRERAARTYRSYTYVFALMSSSLPLLVLYTMLYAYVSLDYLHA